MNASATDVRNSVFDLRTSPLVSVCSEIGRGHPSYLDSVLLALQQADASCTPACAKVAEICAGTSGLAWRAAGLAYRIGARGGVLTWTYNRLRSPDARPSGLQLSILGSDLRKLLVGYEGICIVDHPLLAQILSPACRVAYVHGEIAAPGSSAAPGAWQTFVPLEPTAARLEAFGVKPEALTVTGLIIDQRLLSVAEAALAARVARIGSDQPLTVAFFASGAYPRPHVERTLDAAYSVTRAGHKAILFWGPGMLRAAEMQARLRKNYVREEAVRVVWSRNRADETGRIAGAFGQIDVMVAAAHERTNWAVGLGLPMFALLPNIGPFARENFEFASAQGVCLPLQDAAAAAGLADTIAALRKSGGLAEMARAGWGKHPLTGAAACARILLAARG